MGWVYFLGESKGHIIKIGFTAGGLRKRIDSINREMSVRHDFYYFLGAAIGTPAMEDSIQQYFKDCVYPMGSRCEYFHAEDSLVEYVNWLRERWWTTHDVGTDETKWDQETFDHWMPKPERRVCRPPDDPDKLIQDYQTISGPLAKTPWCWMSVPGALGDDFYTPVEIVKAAREAMGGLDLDAASHWRANRVHKIPEIFHVHRSAMEHDWAGKVWLNPPYGDYGPWFGRILKYVDNGMIEQICMISPVWAFNTKQAIPVMRKASASILLSPTPSFWGHPSETKTGTNHPHMIIYIGERIGNFIGAFANFGIPIRLAWEHMPEAEKLAS